MQILAELISAALQLLLFCLIPFTAHWIGRRNLRGFSAYVGLFSPPPGSYLYGFLTGIFFFAASLGALGLVGRAEVLTAPQTVSGAIRALGPGGQTIAVILIAAVITTSLAEEILFRGFIGKRLFALLGFVRGNAVQAGLFGVLHAVVYSPLVDEVFPILPLITAVASVAYLFGWINEEKGEGSIVPSWCAHALGNALLFSAAVYLL